MDEFVHLMGAETVGRAASQISAAADEMIRAASSIAESIDRLERVLTEDRMERERLRGEGDDGCDCDGCTDGHMDPYLGEGG